MSTTTTTINTQHESLEPDRLIEAKLIEEAARERTVEYYNRLRVITTRQTEGMISLRYTPRGYAVAEKTSTADAR